MQNNEGAEPRQDGSERGEHERAWRQVTRLATAHAGRPSARDRAPAKIAPRAPGSASAVASDELSRAITEIEQASEALRRWEPALEHGMPTAARPREPRAYWVIWFMIALIWISSSVMIVSATAAILYLLR
jgi:hypothetical protein